MTTGLIELFAIIFVLIALAYIVLKISCTGALCPDSTENLGN